MIRFLHAADLHLDTPFRSLSPEQAAQRRAELRQLPQLLVDLANEKQCDLLLLAGDLFDAVGGYAETLEALQRALRACRARVFIAPGNHDFYSPASPYAADGWPEQIHIFSSQTPTGVDVPELGCTVYGAAFTGPTSPPLLRGFHAASPCSLMVLHGDAESADSPYNPISEAEIAASGLGYLALGHIHQAAPLRRAGETCYAWPGCPMGRGFDETGQKGVWLGTLHDGGCELEFLPLPGRRYETLRVPAGEDPLQAILAALPADTAPHSYRITLTGEAPEPPMRALYEALAPRFYSLTLRDETTPPADLWAAAEEDTLRGLTLSRLHEQWRAAPPEEKRRYELAARYVRSVFEGREAPQP